MGSYYYTECLQSIDREKLLKRIKYDVDSWQEHRDSVCKDSENVQKKFNVTFFTKRCNLNDCHVCHLILNISYLYLNKFILPIANHCTCNSKQVVYIIKCIKCNCFYIGETEGIASKRISQHINSILKFDYKETLVFSKPVAEHFRLENHVLNRDFAFLIKI